jgi:hypothetical protein
MENHKPEDEEMGTMYNFKGATVHVIKSLQSRITAM